MKFHSSTFKYLTALVLLSNLTFVACGEAKKNPQDTKPVTPDKNAPQDPAAPQAPQTTDDSKATKDINCETIQQVTNHVAKTAGSSINGASSQRFCLHTVAAANENIIGEPLTDGVTIQTGLKLAFSDVDSLDSGATFAEAKTACESLTLDGGGWKLPARVASDSADATASIDAITAYIKHANRWPIHVRFYASDATLDGGLAQVAVPRTGGVTELFDSAPQAVVCVKK